MHDTVRAFCPPAVKLQFSTPRLYTAEVSVSSRCLTLILGDGSQQLAKELLV